MKRFKDIVTIMVMIVFLAVIAMLSMISLCVIAALVPPLVLPLVMVVNLATLCV